MKTRLQRKYLILIIGYSVMLLLIPYMLDYSKTDPRFKSGPQKQRCLDLENSMGMWNIEETASNETDVAEEYGNRGKTKTFIYLHATWRTGSSFLGELFNQHPDVFYLYEPMWHMWQTLYPGDAESLQGALRDMLGSLFRCDFSVLKLYMASPNLTTASIFGWKRNKVICSEPLCSAYKKDEIGLINEAVCQKCPAMDIKSLERECKKYPVIVIKDVRVLDLGVLVPLMQNPSLNLQHPDVFYLYEPMWHMWQTLYPGDAESLQGALRDMLGSLFRCDFSVLKLYMASPNLTTASIFGWKRNKVICSEPLCSAYKKDEIGLINEAVCQKCPAMDIKSLERECKKYPVIVIKDVRVLDLGVLVPLMQNPSLNLQVIQLFRDPRAVHNSRLKSKQALVRESIQVLRSKQRTDKYKRLVVPNRSQRADSYVTSAMEVICESWLKDLLFIRSAPQWVTRNYIRLRYEDLVLQPVKQLQSLFRFSNLTLLPAIGDFVLNMTQGDKYSSDKPFLISSRDAKEAVHAWRERLSLEQIRQVEAYCSEVMSLLAYH
ncbi:UNVERIFIED_CONTAM: hypothetical protein FKN15_064405 [Acipenser sinensis]